MPNRDSTEGLTIALYDANAHPDVDKSASGPGYGAYVAQAEKAGFVGACAVALPGTNPAAHIAQCRTTRFLTPVAPWKSTVPRKVSSEVKGLVDLGYRALKVHPRLGGTSVGSREFRQLLRVAEDHSFTVFLCTYPFGTARQGLGDQLLADLERAVRGAPTVRMVLLHGGGVDLLRYIEFCRANDNLLLDLSLTLVKYPGSSIDNDISFAFQYFDQRICIGTDYPYCSIAEVVARLKIFVSGLPAEKRENVLHKNLRAFLATPQ